jgi:hypothetical protein
MSDSDNDNPIAILVTDIVEALTCLFRLTLRYGTYIQQCAFFGSESMIGSDVLDIGSRGDSEVLEITAGNPGQFDLPQRARCKFNSM